MNRHFSAYIPHEQDLIDFYHWAFGEDYHQILEAIQCMEAWNILHGDELMLKESGEISIDSTKMVDLWNKR